VRRLPYTPYRSPELFAVEDTAAQFHWRGLEPGPVRIEVYRRDHLGRLLSTHDCRAREPGGIGVGEVGGLEPQTQYRATIFDVGGNEHAVDFTTLMPPQGELLGRFATLSDLHLGTHEFGLFPKAVESPLGAPAHPARAAGAGLDAAAKWGAELVVLKGDLTDNSRPDEWRQLAGLIDTYHLPTQLMLGNHERMRRKDRVDPERPLAEMGRSIDPVLVHDLPGIRLVLVDTTGAHGWGDVRHTRDAAVEAVRGAGPCVVLLHHYLEPFPVPTFWPPGIGPSQSRQFLASLAEANPALMITAGHSHRHRRHRRAGITVTEVGSPKDYPGVWAGYAVHEGGIRQVVRRISEPASLAWTERTRAVMLGAWGHWTPGAMSERCFSLNWPNEASLSPA
jgi:Icc protein